MARHRFTICAAAGRVLAAGCTLTVLACAGGQTSRPLADVAEPLPTSAVARLIEIRIEAAEGGATVVSLVGDRPLRWTTFRDLDGQLIVELPATATSLPAMTTSSDASLLVTRVEAMQTSAGFRGAAGTRLRIASRRDAVHALESRGATLELRFQPAAEQTASRDPVARDPVARDDQPVVDASPAIESESLDLPAATPAPRQPPPQPPRAAAEDTPSPAPPAPPPTAKRVTEDDDDDPGTGADTHAAPATRVERVFTRRVDGGWVVFVSGDGRFETATFRLDDPPRFVVDLRGVVNDAGSGSLELDGPSATRVRWAQFARQPLAITRIVVDLVHAAAEVTVEQAPTGIRLRILPSP